jgi:CheY-like chemotaxis protein/HPt (histidine-containing phosphotransfer) domain-containing protein
MSDTAAGLAEVFTGEQYSDRHDRLVGEFADSVRDTLDELELRLGRAKADPAALAHTFAAVMREAHSLKGAAKSFGYAAIGVIAYRLEDYVTGLGAPDPRALDDIRIFLDRIADVLDGKLDRDGADLPEMVRALPHHSSFDPSEVTVNDVEIMLVMPSGAATKFIERELRECGYRVVKNDDTFDALEMIVHTRPDMVVCSAVTEGLSGIDLACALKAMPATRAIPVSLMTSLSDDDEHMAAVPDSVPVIHKGATFGDDLAEALQKLGIT